MLINVVLELGGNEKKKRKKEKRKKERKKERRLFELVAFIFVQMSKLEEFLHFSLLTKCPY